MRVAPDIRLKESEDAQRPGLVSESASENPKILVRSGSIPPLIGEVPHLGESRKGDSDRGSLASCGRKAVENSTNSVAIESICMGIGPQTGFRNPISSDILPGDWIVAASARRRAPYISKGRIRSQSPRDGSIKFSANAEWHEFGGFSR